MFCATDKKQLKHSERSGEDEKFFRASAQRSQVLKNKISEHVPDTRRAQLISMCDTRWVERHQSIARFVEIYVAIVYALEELQNWPRNETSQKAHQLLSVIA